MAAHSAVPGAGASASTRPVTTGWAVFTASVLLVVGMLAIFFGLAALINDEVVTVGGGGVVIWDFSAWGALYLVTGAAMVLTALGLYAGSTWARGMGVAFVMVHAVAQFGVFTAFPLWAMLMIALDIVIIYQLTSGWDR
jgi:hypothetical protein